MTKSEAGRLGGLKTKEKYGLDHYRKIGKLGYAVTYNLYRFPPTPLKKWLRKNGTHMKKAW